MQNLSWQKYLKNAYSSNNDLCKALKLPNSNQQSNFPLKVPKPFVDKMQKGNAHDPLLLQVLIQQHESIPIAGFNNDPLAENNHTPATGIIHKYYGRALVILAGGCAINCRYCFRRHFNYNHNITNLAKDSEAYQYLLADNSITEVILSGGDPLLHNDNVIKKIINNCNHIPHLQRIRIHTRLPLVIPQRITDSLLNALSISRMPITMVVHCNHPQELDDITKQSFNKLKQAGIVLLNQSVLLKNINDSSTTLIELSTKLFDHGVMPYYLHILDKVAGSAHFDVDDKSIQSIKRTLATNLPGYLVPKIVMDGVNQPFKRFL